MYSLLKVNAWCFQVVREGEEPEEFLNRLRYLALQEMEDIGHGK